MDQKQIKPATQISMAVGFLVFVFLHFFARTTRDIITYGSLAFVMLLFGLGTLVAHFKKGRDLKPPAGRPPQN